MQINYLKKIVEDTAGPPAVKLVDLLYNKKDINEFLIAKKMSLTINQTRNLLYKLSNLGILSSIRKKDKRKGWYIYFWTFEVLKSLEVLKENILKEINNLKTQLTNKQQKRFYKCKICLREVTEEVALLNNFTCPECGEVYELADNKETINEIIKKITKLERDMELINEEISKEKEKKDKKLKKIMRKEEKKRKKLLKEKKSNKKDSKKKVKTKNKAKNNLKKPKKRK